MTQAGLDGPPFPTAALSEPLFLQQIAHRWAFKEDDGDNWIEGDDVRVSDMFDVIGGCGIGGIYAILFARLNMTVGQVIEFHKLLVDELFIADCWTRKDPNNCTTAFDSILNQLVHSGIKIDLDSPFFSKDGTKCLVVILNEARPSSKSLRSLRSYRVRANPSVHCTIRQALHATLADCEHLPPVTIEDELFIGTSNHMSNPARFLLKELAAAFPALHIACFVNLGADYTSPTNDSHNISQDLMSQFQDLGGFFRLSVREELHAESRIKSLVSGYLHEDEVSKTIDEVVETIKGRRPVVNLLRLGNLAGEDGRNELHRKVSHICDEGEIKHALEKIRAPDTFQPIREHGCLLGTREDVLKPIGDWIEEVGDNTPNVFWLEGYPGTGKTAICITLKQRLAKNRFLGASCFFRREDASQHGLSALFRSIASQLVNNRSSIGDNIVHVANSDDFNFESAPSTVFEKLICDPLVAASVGFSEPIVLVLDAIDEFGQSDQDQQYLVNLLLPRWVRLPRHCKLFIASRSQGDLPRYLDLPTHRIRRLAVGDVVSTETIQDIRKFFEHSFEHIHNSYHPSSSELEMLVKASSGLFIWASTIIEMVKKIKFHNPARRFLQSVCAENATVEPGRMQSLHSLYRTVLNPLLDTEEVRHELPSEEFLVKQTFFSALVCARIPLTSNALASLCASEVADIQIIARELTPVMNSAHVLRFVHKSFFDYVLSDDFPFQLDHGRVELVFMRSCFKIMRAQLRFNMGNMPSSYMLNSEIPELYKALSEELQYATRFWGSHLKECKDKAIKLAQLINDFLNHRFLYWVEAVSIIGCFREAMESLLNLRMTQLDKAISDFAQDGLALLRQFAQPISQSYPHIYISAVPWTPTTSLIRMKYLNSVCHALNIMSNGDESWPVQLAVIRGHNSSVWSAAFSPDGSQIVSGSQDNTVRIWDAATRQPIGEPLRGHTDSISSVAFSPNGSQIISGSDDNTVGIWDATTCQPIGEPLRGHTSSVWSVAFSPDGSRIVSGSDDKTVRIWDAATRQPIGEPLRGHTSSVWSVTFSFDGSQIASGSHDHTVRIWDAATHQPVGAPLRGHTDSVPSVAFSPDGSQIVSGSWDNTVRIWDAATRQPVGEPLQGHTSPVLSVAFSPDGSQIVSGSNDKTARTWDAATRQPVGEPLRGHTSSVWSVAFSPDGFQIVSGSHDHTVRIWDAAPRQPIGEPFRCHTDSVWSVAFSPDGSQIVSGSWDNTVCVWDATTRQPIGEPLRGHTASVSSVAFSPNGSRIVSGSHDNTIRIWDAATRWPVGEALQGHSDSISSVAFTPDSSQIVSGSWDNTVRIWNAATHQPVGEPLRGHTSSILSVASSPDGSQIVSGSHDNTIRVWNAVTHQPVGEPLRGHTSSVLSVAFCPDGSQIVSGSQDNTIRIWDAATHQHIGEPLRGHLESVRSVSFCPDGSQIVSGSQDNTLRIWNPATHRPVGEPLRGHTDSVSSVAFSPDGSRIVSGSQDNTVRMWEASTRWPVGEPLNFSKTLLFLRGSHSQPLPCFLLHDGWVTDQHNCRLVWVPQHFHDFLPTPSLVDIVGSRRMVVIDASDLRTGIQWASCIDTNSSGR